MEEGLTKRLCLPIRCAHGKAEGLSHTGCSDEVNDPGNVASLSVHAHAWSNSWPMHVLGASDKHANNAPIQ